MKTKLLRRTDEGNGWIVATWHNNKPVGTIYKGYSGKYVASVFNTEMLTEATFDNPHQAQNFIEENITLKQRSL